MKLILGYNIGEDQKNDDENVEKGKSGCRLSGGGSV